MLKKKKKENIIVKKLAQNKRLKPIIKIKKAASFLSFGAKASRTVFSAAPLIKKGIGFVKKD